MAGNKRYTGKKDDVQIAGMQDYEVDYVAQKLQSEFSSASRRQIEKAVKDSAKVEQFHNNRQMIMNSSRLKLRNL